ncbi:LamG-like jellyroll fold domain-containing protein [Limnospira fusiformis]|uniref:LamG-like jellyroll fold domain-containing protein n=1 Tax=Limnospira fusiformis TaxID=54297 RepID=UPI00296E696F
MSKPVPCLLYLFDMSASDFSRGNEFLRNGQLEEAIAAYQKAIGQNRDFYLVYQNLGEALEKLGRFDEAIAAYRRAVELKPEAAWSYVNLSRVLRQVGRVEEAEKAEEQAVGIDPKLADFSQNGYGIKENISTAVNPTEWQGKRPRVGVCGWELSHNAAGRVYTLAQLYQTFADVEIIGSIFPQWGREVWEPIRQTKIPCHHFFVKDESQFIDEAIKLVRSHPYDIVHLSKPRLPNILFGLLYKSLWNSRVIVDIDDEEMAFVGAESSIELDDYLKKQGRLPDLKELTGTEWTRIAVGLVREFDGVTVSNPALQERYGGVVIRHGRDEARFVPSADLKRRSRERFGIAQDKKVVLFFGTPRKHKGLVTTARALGSLGRKDVVFAIIGDFEDGKLKEELQGIPGVDYVFVGNQPFESIPDVVAVGDICVLLQDADFRVSQFQIPAKLSDALGMGLVVLLSETAAVADVIESGAVVPVAEGDLPAVLDRVLSDEAECDRLRVRGRELFATEFGFGVNGPRLAAVMDSVMVRSSGQEQLSEKLNQLLNGLSSVSSVVSERGQIGSTIKDKKIIVYTCNFGNYESVKEPLAVDPRVEYILFTDRKEIESSNWKVVYINELAENPRRASRLAKILPHKYLPDHDISVYLDSTFTIKEPDIYNMVKQCMGDSDIALYKHSERNCVYDEIDFCEKSDIRNIDSATCSKVRAKYQSINYPRQNGLFENGFIFRRNNSQIQELNELWWSEYVSGAERDQFSFMYCLHLLDVKPNSITIGKQMRKNPFVKWTKHEYKDYQNSIDNSPYYMVYMDKFHDWGTTRLRGWQIYERLKQYLNIQIVPYSKAVHLHNKHMLFLKIRNYDLLIPIIKNNNKVYLDMVDCHSKYINPQKHIFKDVEFGIFATKNSMEFYKKLFKHPEKCQTIYHHWDITLDKFKKDHNLDSVKIGYFGVEPKGFLYGKIPGVDFHEVTSTNFDDALKSKMSNYNVQYIVRPIEEQQEFPALTKISTASVFHAPVISSKTNEVELLGSDYPYYIENLDLQSILKTIDKIKRTFQKYEWNYAVNIMKSIKEKTSINSVVDEYIRLFKSLGEIPSFYTHAQDKRKAIYTANIGGYDRPIPLDPGLAKDWDAYYFSDDPNFDCPGWKHIYVNFDEIKYYSKVACARDIKARPHLYLPNYDVTLWVDSNFVVKRDLNEYLKNLPDDDFITTKHYKRDCIYEELQQPRVVVKTGQAILDRVRHQLESQGFPKHFGLQETNFVLRKNTEKSRIIGDMWWNYMKTFNAYRDQLWLSYILFETGSNITCVHREVRNRYFDITEHPNLVTTTKKYALKFGANNRSYVEIPHQKGLKLTGDLTIEFWVNLAGWPKTWTHIISKQLDDFRNEFCLRLKNANKGQFYYSFDNELVVLEFNPKNVLKLKTWTHVACVRKIGESLKIYINGVLIGETAIITGREATDTEAPLLLMTNVQRQQFINAQMCDLRIWCKALSHHEIIAQMNREIQGNEKGLVGYWKFDSGEGNKLIDNQSFNHGLIYGSTWQKLDFKLGKINSPIQRLKVEEKSYNVS